MAFLLQCYFFIGCNASFNLYCVCVCFSQNNRNSVQTTNHLHLLIKNSNFSILHNLFILFKSNVSNSTSVLGIEAW